MPPDLGAEAWTVVGLAKGRAAGVGVATGATLWVGVAVAAGDGALVAAGVAVAAGEHAATSSVTALRIAAMRLFLMLISHGHDSPYRAARSLLQDAILLSLGWGNVKRKTSPKRAIDPARQVSQLPATVGRTRNADPHVESLLSGPSAVGLDGHG